VLITFGHNGKNVTGKADAINSAELKANRKK
jgi:hypothetical protein